MDIFFMTENGVSISEPMYIIYYLIIVFLITVAFAAGRRTGCHYFCWIAPFMIIGTKIKNFFRWPSLHMRADSDKCVECKLCTKICPMSLKVTEMVQKGNMENTECILCGECADTCTKESINYSSNIPPKNK